MLKLKGGVNYMLQCFEQQVALLNGIILLLLREQGVKLRNVFRTTATKVEFYLQTSGSMYQNNYCFMYVQYIVYPMEEKCLRQLNRPYA